MLWRQNGHAALFRRSWSRARRADAVRAVCASVTVPVDVVAGIVQGLAWRSRSGVACGHHKRRPRPGYGFFTAPGAFVDAVANYDSYVICTSPRSGSTLLCRLLASTGVAGNPDSYFHGPAVADWLGDFGLLADASAPKRGVLEAVFKAAVAAGSLGTGMFGLRLQRHGFDFFTRQLATLHPGPAGDARRLHRAFGRTGFLYLSRRDKVEQAVSYVKAQQTGLWHRARDGSELERLSPPQAPAYDPDSLRARVEEMEAGERQWEQWFATENIAPFRIAYEALSAHPVRTLAEVLDYLGLERAAADAVEPDVVKLADHTNREWVARFRSEHGIALSAGPLPAAGPQPPRGAGARRS